MPNSLEEANSILILKWIPRSLQLRGYYRYNLWTDQWMPGPQQKYLQTLDDSGNLGAERIGLSPNANDETGQLNTYKKFNSPAKQEGLIVHVWSLKELLVFPYHKIQTY